MFGKRKKNQLIEYDQNTQKPVIKCSICNGEQVAGLKDVNTGHFTEVMLIRDENDLAQFKKLVNTDNVTKEY